MAEREPTAPGSDGEERLSPSFWALNISQFLGAMNDNAFRWVMTFALIARATGPNEDAATLPVYLAGAVFAAPFILFSAAAGVLADRFSKRRLIVLTNALEIGVMVLGLFAFLSNCPLLIYGVLFLMLTQSTLFSPCKLGIIPELVARTRISYANGLMSAFVYLAIIAGTVGGDILFRLFGEAGTRPYASTTPYWGAAAVCIVVASCGFLTSLLIRDTGVRSTGKRATPWFWRDIVRNLRKAAADRYLFLTIWAVAFFLFLGAFVQMNLLPYGMQILDMPKNHAMYLWLVLALGIGSGSFLAGKASRFVVEIGFVPVGAGLVAFTSLLLVLPVHSTLFAIPVLFLMASAPASISCRSTPTFSNPHPRKTGAS